MRPAGVEAAVLAAPKLGEGGSAACVSANDASSIEAWGHRPRDFGPDRKIALKARLRGTANESRFQR